MSETKKNTGALTFEELQKKLEDEQVKREEAEKAAEELNEKLAKLESQDKEEPATVKIGSKTYKILTPIFFWPKAKRNVLASELGKKENSDIAKEITRDLSKYSILAEK